MKTLTFNQCKPTAGTYVVVYCAGMAHRPFDTEGDAQKIGDYGDGAAIGRQLPRRLAKRRATRIAREHRAEQNKSANRGHMACAIAKATATDAGFTRYPKSAGVERGASVECSRRLLEIGAYVERGWLALLGVCVSAPLSVYRQQLADEGHCMADGDGDCFWSECPQEANGRANYQSKGCPRYLATVAKMLYPDDEGRAGG